MNTPALLSLSIEPLILWGKRKWLEYQVNREYIHLGFYKDMAKEAHTGQSDASKRIVNLETQLRDL